MKNFAKRISALVLAVVVSAAVLCPAAFAAQLPSLPKDQCVVDEANVLNSSTEQTITELNAQLESSCSGAQIGNTRAMIPQRITPHRLSTLGASVPPPRTTAC